MRIAVRSECTVPADGVSLSDVLATFDRITVSRLLLNLYTWTVRLLVTSRSRKAIALYTPGVREDEIRIWFCDVAVSRAAQR